MSKQNSTQKILTELNGRGKNYSTKTERLLYELGVLSSMLETLCDRDSSNRIYVSEKLSSLPKKENGTN
jgi:hypothetical protein